MKAIITSLILIITLVGSTVSFAQKRTVDLDNFSELSFGVSGTLYLRQGSVQKVEVEASDEVFEKLDFNLKGSKLVIESKDSWGWNNGIKKSELNIYITMVDIQRLALSGSGSMIGENKIESTNLRIDLSGSGSMSLFTLGDELALRISGSGKISLDGRSNSLEARVSGSGSIKARDMEVETVDASISGSGSIYITASEKIKARISGSGSVYYAGDPKRLDSNASGSGKIRKL